MGGNYSHQREGNTEEAREEDGFSWHLSAMNLAGTVRSWELRPSCPHQGLSIKLFIGNFLP